MNLTTRDLLTNAPMVLRCPASDIQDWLTMAESEVCRDTDGIRRIRNTATLTRLRAAAGVE